jgi:hypothetical protein
MTFGVILSVAKNLLPLWTNNGGQMFRFAQHDMGYFIFSVTVVSSNLIGAPARSGTWQAQRTFNIPSSDLIQNEKVPVYPCAPPGEDFCSIYTPHRFPVRWIERDFGYSEDRFYWRHIFQW